jgi:hypothetical protein
MSRQATTHRVSPTVAQAWLDGDAHPPGPGFTEIRHGARRLLVVIAIGAVVWAGIGRLIHEIAEGRIW